MAAMMMTMTAQAKTQDWGGLVVDENGEPMPYVNVVLLSLPDSAFVQGAMTDEHGVFKIVTNVNNGVFKVSSVGYQTLYINAGEGITIQMKEDTQILGEVVVKSQLPKTHAKGDAMRTTVAGTIDACEGRCHADHCCRNDSRESRNGERRPFEDSLARG